MMPATLTIATCGNYQHDHQPHLLHISHIPSLLWMSGYNVVVMEWGGCMFMYLHTIICNQLWYWRCKYLIIFSWQSVGARTSPLRRGSVDGMLFSFISLVRKKIISFWVIILSEKLPTVPPSVVRVDIISWQYACIPLLTCIHLQLRKKFVISEWIWIFTRTSLLLARAHQTTARVERWRSTLSKIFLIFL